MANMLAFFEANIKKYRKASGTGTNADPFIPESSISSISVPTAIYNGQNTVASAGTREPLASTQAILSGVTVKALAGNSGIVYVGDNTVAAANGLELSASESVFIEVDDVATVNIDAAEDGDGVGWIAS